MQIEIGTSWTQYQEFIYKSRYARWMESEKRRENWGETVKRYVNFFAPRLPESERESICLELDAAIYNLEVMPSMRALMTAGKALERDNCAGYNCSYIAVDDQRAFDEAMYISMCGTGVGFSVERQYINQLPVIAENFYKSGICISVRDSKVGWAAAFKELIALLYSGMIPSWDMSALRPAGAILKTFGGRASGPGPLDELFKFTVRLFQNAAGRKLTSIECHDLMCKIADVVVSGGVRRSAMISLSNLSDDRMRNAKNGEWHIENPHRRLANNSAVYTDKPDLGIFLHEWLTLYNSRSGERGVFNRQAATLQAKSTGRRKWEGVDFGTNPCGEIILRSMGFCNLTEVVIRPKDTFEDLKRKVRVAAILGTLQASLIDFRYLRSGWKKNAEEEALLGISFTGIMDNPIMYMTDLDLESRLCQLKHYAYEVNLEFASKLNINPAAAITCVKPSGTVSQLVDSASGIHPRYAPYVMRAVRNDKKDPIGSLLKATGVRNEPDAFSPNETDVFYFPLKSPNTSICRNDLTAIDQLELYLIYRKAWCEHNPSCTVYVRESEWIEVAAWIYKHFDEIGGLTFLPFSEHSYKQPPYEEITEEEYRKAVSEMPAIDWSKLPEFEKEDGTLHVRDLACSAGQCEL